MEYINSMCFPYWKSFTGYGASLDVSVNQWEPSVRDILELHPAPMSPTWVKYFLDIAAVVASKSKDRTKVGCVLVNPNNKQILSTGFNGFCRDVADTQERYADREVKMDYVVHAEANAICFAAFSGMSTEGSYAFITLPPCHGCAKLLKQAGVTHVFYTPERETSQKQEIQDDWRKKTQLSLDILHEAGVQTFHCLAVNEETPNDLKVLVVQDLLSRPIKEDGTITEYRSVKDSISEELFSHLYALRDGLYRYLKDRLIPDRFLEQLNERKLNTTEQVPAVQYLNNERKLDITERVAVVRYLNVEMDRLGLKLYQEYDPEFPKFVLDDGKINVALNYTVNHVTPV